MEDTIVVLRFPDLAHAEGALQELKRAAGGVSARRP
jgi:hypothetical protein